MVEMALNDGKESLTDLDDSRVRSAANYPGRRVRRIGALPSLREELAKLLVILGFEET
jgi:hypothetical protein